VRPGAMGGPSSSSYRDSGSAAALMIEDFETVWPSSGWVLTDTSELDGGEYLWGKRDCHPHTGTYGGWCVGGGADGSALTCSDVYTNEVTSWATYGPFSLATAGRASLQFHLWGEAEWIDTCDYDYLFVGSSTDGDNFLGDAYCGDWTDGDAGNGYHRLSLDLSSRLGESQVWIAFEFVSDYSNTYSGFTIDDVLLSTESSHLPLVLRDYSPPAPSPTPTPTLSPCPQAGSWSGTTGGGGPVSFDVVRSPGCAVRDLTIEYRVYCELGSWFDATAEFHSDRPIVTDHFDTGGSTPRVQGDFTSATEASGTWSYLGSNPHDPDEYCHHGGS
jgi:hypothetical protein